MSDITSFIHHLKKEEQAQVTSFLTHFISRDETGNKEKQLFELITQTDEAKLNDNYFSEKIYKTKAGPSYRKLKSRLFQHILDALVMDAYIGNKLIMGETDRQQIRLKKRLLQFRILLRTGHDRDLEMMRRFLNEIILESRAAELYDILVEALYFKKFVDGVMKNSASGSTLDDEINFYNACYSALQRATDYFLQLISERESVSRYSRSQFISHMRQAIAMIEEDVAKTHSVRIRYYLIRLQIALFQYLNDHPAAIMSCEELRELMNKHKIVYRPERMGFVHDNLCHCHVLMGHFNTAIKHAQDAQKHYRPGAFNHLISREQEFYALFYSANLKRALTISRELQAHPMLGQGEFRHGKMIYYTACIHFKQGHFKETLSIISQLPELSRDKARWEISLRFLKVMCLIELRDLKGASDVIESLRKHLERTNRKLSVHERDQLIFNFLREYEKSSFEFSSPGTKLLASFEKLAEEGKPASWHYFSHELIPFHLWIKGRLPSKKTVKVPPQ
jgi:hypothetical protein